MKRDELLAQALKLPESDRVELAVRLIESLDSGSDPGVDEAWAAEIERRSAASDAGSNATSDWNDLRQRIERDIFGR